VVTLVDDDRKGIIWIPEARFGLGWWRFVTELCSLLAALTSLPRFSYEGYVLEDCSSGSLQVVKADKSFAEVLCSSSSEGDGFNWASAYFIAEDQSPPDGE
jgi:hypothetical protein